MPKSTSELMMLIANITALIAIGMIALKIRKYIEDRVYEALSKDEVIQKISLLVKPDMIFDEDGSFLSDRGASSLIKDRGLSISFGSVMSHRVPTEIRISFKKHLKTSPLMTSLSTDDIIIRSQRGTEHTWIFSLHYTGIDTPDDGTTVKRAFRLEIM